MILDTPIETTRLRLRTLTEDDINPAYLGWLTDPDVVRHLEVRFADRGVEATRAFVSGANDSADTLLLGIVVHATGRHIGNIKLGPINPWHRRAELGLLIGERSEWGRGYAAEAIDGVTLHAFTALGIDKVTAGCYAENEGSRRAFLKAGYREIGRSARHWLCDGRWQDNVMLERLASFVDESAR